MEKKREVTGRFNLITGENTYSSQVAQDPRTARKLKSFIPSDAGDLLREQFEPKYINATVPSSVLGMYEFQRNDGAGAVTRHHFIATSTKLYRDVAGVWTDQGLTLAAAPVAYTLNNLFHVSDGVNSWIWDGTSWLKEGFRIPLSLVSLDTTTPAAATVAAAGIPGTSRASNVVTVTTTAAHGFTTGQLVVIAGVTDTSFNGTFSITVTGATTFTYAQTGANATSGGGTATLQTFSAAANRYYWFTYADETDGRAHESSSSPISAGGGVLTNQKVRVYQSPGTASVNIGTTGVTGVGTTFLTSAVAGDKFYINGLDFGTIASVTNDLALVLTTNAPSTQTTQQYTIAPPRATHWHIYASESDNSKIGYFLKSKLVTEHFHDDQSPFTGASNSTFTSIRRPKRNDPPIASLIGSVFKERAWRRRETIPNFFLYSAGAEVEAGSNGSPYESYPGTDSGTISDLLNEQSYPVESNRIRAITPHGEGLYIATERQNVPLFGEDITDFAISQVTAFNRGVAGRWAQVSTPHGLIFVSYDRKVYLYPSVQIPYNADQSSSLIEIGLGITPVLETIDPTDLDNVRLKYYSYGRRDWLVLAFKTTGAVYRTYVYDFEIKAWFELQRGFTSLDVWEVSAGNLMLVGGAADGYVYVIDDQTGTYNMDGGTYPAATWKPSLIDFGNPDTNHLVQYIEFELTNANLKPDITVTFWLDPKDVDNPGTGRTVTISPVKGANRYRGFFLGGSVCQRILIQFSLAASSNYGGFRSVKLKAEPVTGLLF